MKAKFSFDRLIRTLARAKRRIKWHMPEILGTLGIAGVGGTLVTGIVAGRKAMKANIDATLDKGGTLSTKEAFKVEYKYYIPPAIFALLTAASVYGGMRIGANQRKTLSATIAALVISAKKFRKDAREKMGDQAFLELMDKQVDDKVEAIAKKTNKEWLLDGSAEKLIFFEANHHQFFEATSEEVRLAEYHLNRKFALFGACTLNDFYDLLGIPKTEVGEILGWEQYVGECDYGYKFIDFEHRKKTVDITGNGDFVDVWVIDEPFAATEDCGPYAKGE